MKLIAKYSEHDEDVRALNKYSKRNHGNASMGMGDGPSYLMVIPEKRIHDKHKNPLEVTDEIFSHTRSKSLEHRDRLKKIYQKNPIKKVS